MGKVTQVVSASLAQGHGAGRFPEGWQDALPVTLNAKRMKREVRV